MIINEEIVEIFKSKKIPVDEGILYLLSIFFNINSKYIPDEFKSKINSLRIVEINNTGLIWNKPLFQDQNIHFSWVSDIRNMFSNINKERSGSLTLCVKKMKKLFSLYPHIRKDDVIAATEMYITSIKDPQYILKSHNFIYKDNDITDSTLLSYLETYYEKKEESNKNHITNIMQ